MKKPRNTCLDGELNLRKTSSQLSWRKKLQESTLSNRDKIPGNLKYLSKTFVSIRIDQDDNLFIVYAISVSLVESLRIYNINKILKAKFTLFNN